METEAVSTMLKTLTSQLNSCFTLKCHAEQEQRFFSGGNNNINCKWGNPWDQVVNYYQGSVRMDAALLTFLLGFFSHLSDV